MAVQLFAIIDIGSFDLELAVYEAGAKGRIRRLESINCNIALGNDTYEKGSISYCMMEKLCTYLASFREVVEGYGIDLKNVVVFGTSAMREAKNRIIVEDQIRIRCGFDVRTMSNSEQRFLSYKAIPLLVPDFDTLIKSDTAIVDVGYGSMQVTLYSDNRLENTQNIRLGALRIQALLEKMAAESRDYRLITEELVDHETESFGGYFLKGRKIENIIAVGDCMRIFASKILGFKGLGTIPAENYMKIYEIISTMNVQELAAAYDLPTGFAHLVLPVAMIYYRILVKTGARMIYVTGSSLCDGVAVDWAIGKKLIKQQHDFSEDIISAVRQINKRYGADAAHTSMIEAVSDSLFDCTKKLHGMGKREKLLLKISAILHDVGKYINMTAPGNCGYDIIMATEILGLSHEEREIVANVVKYNTLELERYDMDRAWSKEKYILIYKLSSILRLANILDRSHKQKLANSSFCIRGDELCITAVTDENIALERGLIEEKSVFFEEAFGLKVVLHTRKRR